MSKNLLQNFAFRHVYAVRKIELKPEFPNTEILSTEVVVVGGAFIVE